MPQLAGLPQKAPDLAAIHSMEGSLGTVVAAAKSAGSSDSEEKVQPQQRSGMAQLAAKQASDPMIW